MFRKYQWQSFTPVKSCITTPFQYEQTLQFPHFPSDSFRANRRRCLNDCFNIFEFNFPYTKERFPRVNRNFSHFSGVQILHNKKNNIQFRRVSPRPWKRTLFENSFSVHPNRDSIPVKVTFHQIQSGKSFRQPVGTHSPVSTGIAHSSATQPRKNKEKRRTTKKKLLKKLWSSSLLFFAQQSW